jgi:predicted HTH transcriptional regulator
MTENELRHALEFGREQRGVEFKCAGSRDDKQLLAKVVRAMLGMANKPGGGSVIIGVTDGGSMLTPIGLSGDELASWDYDAVASKVSLFADPYMDFILDKVVMDGKDFVAIQVSEFDREPVLCKRDFPGVLRNGALYVRGRGRVETVEVPSHVEMREVVNRAAEMIAREIVATHSRLSSATPWVESRNDERFDDEAKDLL